MIEPKEHPTTGRASADRYLAGGYETVAGMSSRLAAAICGRLMRIQSDLGIAGHFAEIGAFEGRFLIAMAHCLEPGERALGMDVFSWPDAGVRGRFEANCAKHGIAPAAWIAWQVDSNTTTPDEIRAKLDGGLARMFHVDGEHSRKALAQDLELATACIAPGGLIVLDDMLHPGYPTLMVTVQAYLDRHPEMTVLCIIDRESIVAAAKFVLCRTAWFKRYEALMLDTFKPWTWPLGADFEPHWCLVLSMDTRLAAVE
ncbi:MAG: class I SAM-dependent methyltransferase [Hyphomicrobiaceae bacterium]